jgi:hypothetical protein
VADLDVEGVPGSDRHGHEAKTSKGLDHKDRLWHTSHARWWSSPSAGFPTPTSHDGLRRVLSVHTPGKNVGRARGALGTDFNGFDSFFPWMHP